MTCSALLPFGVSADEIQALLDYGCSEEEVEEMLYDPTPLHEMTGELLYAIRKVVTQ